jgi:hypothetical protein
MHRRDCDVAGMEKRVKDGPRENAALGVYSKYES